MKKLLMMLVAALTVAGCSSAAPQTDTATAEPPDNAAMGEVDALPTATPGEVTVVNVMSNVTAEGVPNGAAYLTVLNGLDEEITLVSAEVNSLVAEELTMHETVDDNGILRMVEKPEGFVIPAGEALMLEPGKQHIMLENLSEPLAEGSRYELTLNFDGVDSQIVNVPVLPFGVGLADYDGINHGEMDHGEMDHGEMGMMASSLISDVETLDAASLHELDETLIEGGEIEADAVEMVNQFLVDFNAIGWPEALGTQVADANDSLVGLEEALAAGDAESAQSLAATAHDQIHALGKAVAGEEDEHSHGD